MKTIGILGGLGPEATVDYYKEIINGFKVINVDGSLTYPEMVIFSVTMSKFIGLLEKGKETQAANYLIECLNKIKRSGADFAVISANTPHMFFDYIQSKADLPLISIVKSCASAAKQLGLSRCALIGTKFTMQKRLLSKSSSPSIHIFIPHSIIRISYSKPEATFNATADTILFH
ncbi:MAG: amino acid racemase [Bacteroidales bacterium]|nr:amino acid racemase [Bacteroidales bacterium]